MKHLFRRKSAPAFTIAEVLLSAFLLTAGIATVMSLFTASHRSSYDTRNIIIASGLAQEGVEVVRNIRDNNLAYRAANWTTGDVCQSSTSGNCDPFRYFPTGANSRCTVNYASSGSGAMSCPPGSPGIAINGALYQHSAGATRFYRIVKVDYIPPNTTARVQSFVTWQDPAGNLNNNGAVSWCSDPLNKCVYTELLLSAWK